MIFSWSFALHSLMTNDVEHLLIYLLCCPFIHLLWKKIYSGLCWFSVPLFAFLLLSCKSSLYFLHTRLLSKIRFANSLSHVVNCLFTLLIVSFNKNNFNENQFIYLFLSLLVGRHPSWFFYYGCTLTQYNLVLGELPDIITLC